MVDKLWFSFNKRHTIKCQEDFMKMSYRSSVNVGEARIDAGGLKLEAGTSNCMKRSSSFELTSFVTSLDNNVRASSLIKGWLYDKRIKGKNLKPGGAD